MVETQKKGPFYLITGLIIGLAIGIFYGWVVNPTRYVDISPQSLHRDQKMQYVLLAAQSYQANEDIGRSYARIKQMMDPVNLDDLRAMLLEMEINPDYHEQFEVVRNFVNSLDLYLQTMTNAGQTPGEPIIVPVMPVNETPVNAADAPPEGLQVEPTDPASDFFVISE